MYSAKNFHKSLAFVVILITFLFAKDGISQSDRYGMDFSTQWGWDDLTNVTINNAREMAPVLEDVRNSLTLIEARVLFRELSYLNNLSDLRNLSSAAVEDDSPYKTLWVEKIDQDFGSYNFSEDFAGLLEAAVKLMRLRNSMSELIPSFKEREYLPQPINAEFSNLRLDMNYSAIDDLIAFYESGGTQSDNADQIIRSQPYRMLFETRRTQDINSTKLSNNLKLSASPNPLYNLYKWLNPESFSGFGSISLYPTYYKKVINTLIQNQDNINKYVLERVGMYLPENFPLYAEAFFLVGSGEPAWFNENGALGISLEYFGDEYNYIVSYLIHEFYSLAEDNIQIPVYEFLLSGQDLKFMKLIRDVTRVGTSNYVGPIGTQNRPSDLLEKDFKIFNTTFNSLYNQGNLEQTDSLIRLGFEGVGPFYTMGTQMAYIIENTDGRKALIESIKMGPVYFFKNYIKAYEEYPDEIRKVFRFSNKIEEKIDKFSKIFNSDIMSEALLLKNLTATPSAMEDGINKYEKKFTNVNASLVNLIIAQLYLEAGEYEKARDYFFKGLGKTNIATSSEEIGKRFMIKKAYPQALEFFTLFIENFPNDPYAYEIRGECYYKFNDMENARKDFEKALEIEPELNVSRLYLEKIP
ncbi:MAG: tetratricopeptide repeat protein [Ignavibacteriae bacterium]|nr:tetratricopeptide repeat protein [Ignavibacteriota bacterium]MCB9244778.1 tetratricopeptide repeat protein [Ignavibacteriales bacterium]